MHPETPMDSDHRGLESFAVKPAVIGLGICGLFLTGIGMIAGWIFLQSGLFQVTQWLQVIGPLLIAVALIFYFRPLRPRVGAFAVTTASIGALLWGVSNLPFVLSSQTAGDPMWSAFFFHAWGVSFLLIALSAFAILWIKEARLVRHDTSPEHTIATSFRTLAAIGVGALVISIAYFMQATDGQGIRISWILQAVGPLLVALVLIATFKNNAQFVGRAGLILGIIAFTVWGASVIPLVVAPALQTNITWAPFLLGGCYGIGFLLLGFQMCFVLRAMRASLQPSNTGA